jgi:ribonuclease III
MPRRSRPSGRPSTTSRRTSRTRRASGPRALRTLIDALPQGALDRAFTHPSLTSEPTESYERLEFLGDAVLGFVIANALFERYPGEREGHLSRVRAHVVSRKSCAEVGRELGLDTLLVERAEVSSDVSQSGNVLAALVEAVIAALYLEHGLEAIEAPVTEAFEPRIREAELLPIDEKTRLQESLAQTKQKVSYAVLAVEGPPHDRQFTCAATVDGEQLGVGTGRTKKEAEQAAAQRALEALEASGDEEE